MRLPIIYELALFGCITHTQNQHFHKENASSSITIALLGKRITLQFELVNIVSQMLAIRMQIFGCHSYSI